VRDLGWQKITAASEGHRGEPQKQVLAGPGCGFAAEVSLFREKIPNNGTACIFSDGVSRFYVGESDDDGSPCGQWFVVEKADWRIGKGNDSADQEAGRLSTWCRQYGDVRSSVRETSATG